ncbi:MAG TPA: hypothetical protein VHQ88_16445 [Burkholderiales bacterium]|jgi:hypothetical protein|nr:hypothetical protein [Burkholderiales bacterium]
MEKAAALKILQQLADGTDPHTGKAFGADSPYQHPDTVRALFVALRALDAPAAAPAAGKQRAAAAESAPSNSGKPWSDDEDKALAAAFDAGKQILELATAHQRSRFAIEVRLAKLGKIEQPANMRGRKVASDTAAYSAQH